jgi:LacI family gluconate utilization system Gnt-I transcriptional repressor
LDATTIRTRPGSPRPGLARPGSTRPGRATLSDVARRAGASDITVSRVVRGQGSIAAGTRKRVLGAIQALGYIPNRSASALASSSSPLVGIVLPSVANAVMAELVQGLNEGLAAGCFQSAIGISDHDPAVEERLVGSLLAWQPAALVLAGLEHSEGTRVLLRTAGVPVVEVLDIDGRGFDSVVSFSHHAAGAGSARHLLAPGYRRFGYVGHAASCDLRADKRRAGFEAVLHEADLDWLGLEVAPGPLSAGAGRAVPAQLLGRAPGLDAAYFSSDDMAVGGLFHCLAEGIGVPARLALFSFNGLDLGQAAPLPLSTIGTPRARIGQEAARLLCEAAPPQVLDLGFELIGGATA